MAVTKVTIVDSPEKMRTQSAGYSIIIPQIKKGRLILDKQTPKRRARASLIKRITVLLPELGPPLGGHFLKSLFK